MYSGLWFVTDGVKVLSVFNSGKEAEREIGRYEDDPDFQYYEFYNIDVDDLEDYPDEYDIALDQGFLG